MSMVAEAASRMKAPPPLDTFAHVSLPCRDLEEGKRFYGDVLGGTLHIDTPTFSAFLFGSVQVGIGTVGCTWSRPDTEYPHVAFYVPPETIDRMREWLPYCGIPISNLWTRYGVEALMFFRDPSGNVLELYCRKGYRDADRLPRGGPQGQDIAVDITRLVYDSWNPPPPRG